MSFFLKNWSILKADILKVFQDFFQNGVINNRTNETYICLIPMKLRANKVSEFRPISLISSLYKLIAKVLVERLKKVLPHIISDAQTTFVEGRQILGAILIASEVVGEWSTKVRIRRVPT